MSCRLLESRVMTKTLLEGLSSVLPMEVCPIFTPTELETLFCGIKDVDVGLLQQNTEYEQVVDLNQLPSSS